MKRELFKEMEMPKGIEMTMKESLITIKGPEGENKRELNLGKLEFELKDNKIKIGHKKSSKKEKKQINTIFALQFNRKRKMTKTYFEGVFKFFLNPFN